VEPLPNDKPLFKMKKFQQVESKLRLPKWIPGGGQVTGRGTL